MVALDPGTKRIGVAVSDENRQIARTLPIVSRRSWKNLLIEIKNILAEFDAIALVIGLPLEFGGEESEMSAEARDLARKFELSLDIPVFLQDERATTYEARGKLWKSGADKKEIAAKLDSEAAAIILGDFLDRLNSA
ncbi:MAG: Holliday junction resolvase RuvX [Blastocatellia bacterium]